jgi:hypothetical protein
MFGIRYSYSDNYYATDGEDRGCSARDGNMAFNANQDAPFIVAVNHHFFTESL